MMAICMLPVAAFAAPQLDTIGPWRVSPYQGQQAHQCLMAQGDGDNGFLYALPTTEGAVQIIFEYPGLVFSADSLMNYELQFDDQDPVRIKGTQKDTSTVFLDGAASSEEEQEEDIVPIMMRGSATLTIKSGQLSKTFDIRQASEAFAKLDECVAQATPKVATAEEVQAQQSDGLDSAFDSMAATAPAVAQFTCSVNGTTFTGIPDMGYERRSPPTEMTIAITADGKAAINGSLVTPQRVQNDNDVGASLVAAAYSFDDVFTALLGGAGAGATIGTFTPEENASVQAIPQIQTAMIKQAMGDRQRYMMVSLAVSSVVFFDLDAQGQAANRAQAECLRTQ